METENLQGELMVTDSLNAGANPSILADSVWLLSSFSNKFNTNVSVQKGDSLKTKTLAFMRGAGHGEYDKRHLRFRQTKVCMCLIVLPMGIKYTHCHELHKQNGLMEIIRLMKAMI